MRTFEHAEAITLRISTILIVLMNLKLLSLKLLAEVLWRESVIVHVTILSSTCESESVGRKAHTVDRAEMTNYLS